MKPETITNSFHTRSIIVAGAANLLLGASSLYWRELDGIQIFILVAYRVLLSTAILSMLIFALKIHHQLKRATIKIILLHGVASLLIAVNWGCFIWSSINDFILESGLGYLLAPFLSIAFGAILYHETVSTTKAASLIVALLLISTLIISTSNLNHWTYLLISTTWGMYTLIKKITPLDAIAGLFIEMLFLTVPLALAFVWHDLPFVLTREESSGSNHLIWLAGGVSITPLLMFSYATKKISLFHTGLLQFLLPLTLISIATFRQKSDEITPLTLALITTCILFALTAYDLKSSHPSKKRKIK